MTQSLRMLAALLLVAGCDGADSSAAKTESATKAAAEGKASDEGKAADAPKYAAPPDICKLPDLSLLGEDAGKPGEGTKETETIRFKTDSCVFDLVGDSINTFKLFVAVDDDAAARYAFAEESMHNAKSAAFESEDVSGVGTKAIYAVQLTAENIRINTLFATYEGNLYVEARLIAGGKKPWDADDMRDRTAKLVRDVMSKVPKG